MPSLTTRVDSHGNPVSGSSVTIDLYDAAVDHLLAYRDEVVDAMTWFATEEPDFAMGLVLAAYLSLTSTDVPDVAAARQMAARLDTLALNDRETAHRAALDTWLSGDWHGAARRLDALLIRWPADLLGLLVGHQLDFYLGDAANLRDRVGRSLPAIDPAHPHHGYVRGMYAFGLEESGNYQLAERHGLAALERNRDDVWATHAVTHVYEMQGRVDEGIRFLRGRQSDWGEGNLFAVHNWWHLALYLLEAECSDESLAIYDRHIHHDHSAGVPLEMLDASALLWRLHLDGIEVGARFVSLADAWTTRTSDEPWYVFNDLHAVMALAGAGRLGDARAVIDRLDAYVAQAVPSSNVRMTAEVGLPACRSVLAYAEDRHADVVAELMPIRTIFARFGGSHAQRDALQRTLVVSAIRCGQLDVARALLAERLSVRETSVWSWRRRGEVLRAAGDAGAADRADQRAANNASRFAAAEPPRPRRLSA
jgi:tetratricopeptide (TPR) repeat protein